MSEEVKARLKAAAEARKGRENLNGLERDFGMVMLDKLMDDLGDIPEVVVNRAGNVHIPNTSKFHYLEDADGNTVRLTFRFWKGERPPIRFTWTRLRYCPDWIVEEFVKRDLGHRRVTLQAYNGPQNPKTLESYLLAKLPLAAHYIRLLGPTEFPKTLGSSLLVKLPLAAHYIRLLWPTEFPKKFATYLQPVSDALIKRSPGIGSVLQLKTYNGGPFDEIVTVTAVTRERAILAKSEGGQLFTLDRDVDEWEVIG